MFIPAWTKNLMTLVFLSSISPGWVVMFLDSNRTLFTFRSCLDLRGVALAFFISILKIFKLLQNYWYKVTDIASFEKHLESSSGHTLSFNLNLLKYRSSICFWRNPSIGPLRWYSLETKEGQKRSEFRLVGLDNSQTPPTSKVWLSDHRGL